MRQRVEPELIADAGSLAGRGPLLVVGGTFDPPHIGHVMLSAAARQALWGGKGWLVYVPAARSPLKDIAGEASATDRVAMLRLALEGCERACIWTFEVERPPPSYTVDTLRALRKAVGAAEEVRLLMGADQAARFREWRNPLEIIALAEPVVVPRGPCRDVSVFVAAMKVTGAWSDEELAAWQGRFVPVPLVDISASAARKALHQTHRPAAALRRMLPPGVLEYIERQRLYI